MGGEKARGIELGYLIKKLGCNSIKKKSLLHGRSIEMFIEVDDIGGREEVMAHLPRGCGSRE